MNPVLKPVEAVVGAVETNPKLGVAVEGAPKLGVAVVSPPKLKALAAGAVCPIPLDAGAPNENPEVFAFPPKFKPGVAATEEAGAPPNDNADKNFKHLSISFIVTSAII